MLHASFSQVNSHRNYVSLRDALKRDYDEVIKYTTRTSSAPHKTGGGAANGGRTEEGG